MFPSASACSSVYISKWSLCLGTLEAQGWDVLPQSPYTSTLVDLSLTSEKEIQFCWKDCIPKAECQLQAESFCKTSKWVPSGKTGESFEHLWGLFWSFCHGSSLLSWEQWKSVLWPCLATCASNWWCRKKHLGLERTKDCFITHRPSCQAPPLLVGGWCLGSSPPLPSRPLKTNLSPSKAHVNAHCCFLYVVPSGLKSVKLCMVLSYWQSILGFRYTEGFNSCLVFFHLTQLGIFFFVLRE